MKSTKLLFAIAAIALCGCGDSNGNKTSGSGLTGGLEDNSEEYLAEDVNAIDQALPEIMVLPSDQVLKMFDSYRMREGQVQRNYNKYLIENPDNKAMMSTIQGEFIKQNYPLNDLEQTLKQLATREATDEADEFAKDAKTLLLATAHPDIIIELDYKTKLSKGNRTLSYTLNLLDAYTNKVFATKSINGADGTSLTDAFEKSINQNIDDINNDIRKYFSTLLTKGREITVRFVIDSKCNFTFEDNTIEDEPLSDWCRDFMKMHTVKGAYKLSTNTKMEQNYTNARIKPLSEDGTQYNAYELGRECCKALKKELGIKATNKSQGLSEVVISITGM